MSIFFAMNREDEEATTLLPSFFLSSYRSGKKLETNFEDIVKKNRRKTKDRIGERSKKKKSSERHSKRRNDSWAKNGNQQIKKKL